MVAAFGEKQFNETGAQAVEVLRVKASVMRKHFRQLKGILFLVAVISLDRIRVYFFNGAGVMVIGENLEQKMYEKVRRSSKIVAKFEKPKELTPEELRIEATQELRDSLGKAIRKVSRILALKEPAFPDIFVIRTHSPEQTQTFGLEITDDDEFLFEENTLSQSWIEGLLLRVAFLIHLKKQSRKTQIAHSIGNAIGLTLLKNPGRQAWLEEWRRQSKDTEWQSYVNHFVKHASSYTSESYNWFQSVIDELSQDPTHEVWRSTLSVLHDSLLLPIGTQEYHVIDSFCKSLRNLRQLEKRRHTFEAIHLAPRVICDPSPLGVSLSFMTATKPTQDSWVQIQYLDGRTQRYAEIRDSQGEKLTSIEYWLNLQDIYPSAGSPFSHGKDIIRRALEKLGLSKTIDGTYDSQLSILPDRKIEHKEEAVLERLSLGKLEILSNTLVGSPMAVLSLIEKGSIALLPDFYHVGLDNDFLLHGSYEDVKMISRSNPEATVFGLGDEAYSVVSAPSSWKQPLISSAVSTGVDLYPIVSVTSARSILREEHLFSDEDLVRWV